MKRIFLWLLAIPLIAAGCSKLPDSSSTESDDTTYYANLFAYSCMRSYYLWEKEVSDQLDTWKKTEDPIQKVRSARYKDRYGEDIDKWTELMEDYSSFASSVSGNGKTFGFEFVLFASGNTVIPEVTYTYAGSPAEKALVRGDIIMKVDGEALTRDNYVEVLTEKLYNHPSTLTLQLRDGSLRQLQAVEMYSNPVHTVRTLKGARNIGYLHFTSFTDEAVKDLENVFRQFKEDGIEELVLDLRYNTGGYESTATALASMIAPPEVVAAKAVFSQSVYNNRLTEIYSSETYFDDQYLAVNPGVSRLWVIVTGHSASASELLICGLAPYMNVMLVGTNTYGKFCGGYLLPAAAWYDAVAKETDEIDCKKGREATEKWGLYVIASRYADCNGETLSMPSGIPPHYEAYDDPDDGYALGDPLESMLAEVLRRAGAIDARSAAAAVKGTARPETLPFTKPYDGVLLY